MNTKPFQMLFNVLAILALALALLPPAARAAVPIDDPGLAGRAPLAPRAPQILGGTNGLGNLRITLYDSGRVGIERDATGSGGWQTVVYDGGGDPDKGSRLQYQNPISNTGYYFGYYSTASGTGSQNLATPVSNNTAGNTIVSVWIAGNTRVTQTTTYNAGDPFVRYDWDIQNITGAPISGLRFFHGQDTFLAGGDNGAGFWINDLKIIGVRKFVSGQEQRWHLQGVTPPYAYESNDYQQVQSNVQDGALPSTVNACLLTSTCSGGATIPEDIDNGYALEWRYAGNLAPGAVWHITAYERFIVQPAESIMVNAPISPTLIPQGAAADLVYAIVNPTNSAINNVALTVSKNQPTWSAAVQGATTVNVPANSSITATVRVTVPTGASIGATGFITLTADSAASGASSDKATVIVTEGIVLTIARAGTGDGVVTPTVGMHSYPSGTVVTLGATAYPTSTFEGWSGDADCADGSVTMTANKACTATFTLSAQPPSLALTKTASPSPAKPGEAITYTIAFSNSGAITATDVTISDTLSPNITNPHYTSTVNLIPLAGGTVYAWSAPDLAPGEGGIITITGVLTKPLAAGVFTNTVTLAVSGTVKTAAAPLTVLNVAPVANAGVDQMVGVGRQATLHGSGTDDNGDTLAYGWKQTGGLTVTLSSPMAQSPTFTAPSTAAVLTFTLTVTDTGGLMSAPDEVVVKIRYIYYWPIIFKNATYP